MKTIRTLALTAAFAFAALSANAASLDQARSQGLVGERADGYIAAVGSPSAEVQSLVSTINAQRKAEYQRIASQNGQPVAVVEKLAAEKLISKAAPGTYVQSPSGQWVKK